MSTEQHSVPPSEVESDLSLHEQVLVKSASVIDEHRCDAKTKLEKHGQWAWSDWIDPTDGMNFRLFEYTERMNPETVFMTYKLKGYDESIDNPIFTFNYDSYGNRFYKSDKDSKQRKCKKEDIEDLLHCLQSAPGNIVYDEDSVNQKFTAIMHKEEIHDPRFSARLKRTFANGVLRMLQR